MTAYVKNKFMNNWYELNSIANLNNFLESFNEAKESKQLNDQRKNKVIIKY